MARSVVGRPTHRAFEPGRWPSGIAVARLLGGLIVAVIVVGWILTATNGGA